MKKLFFLLLIVGCTIDAQNPAIELRFIFEYPYDLPNGKHFIIHGDQAADTASLSPVPVDTVLFYNDTIRYEWKFEAVQDYFVYGVQVETDQGDKSDIPYTRNYVYNEFAPVAPIVKGIEK